MKIVFTLCFLAITTSAFSFWKWTKVHSLDNGKRFEATSFAIGAKGYVTCGIDTNDNCYNDLWEYDPAFNAWTQKANLPASYRRGAFGFSVSGMGYIGGGIDDAISASGNIFNDFWMYNPTTNAWTSKASIPFSAFRSAGVACNGKGYIIGGTNQSAPLNNVYEYNPTSNSWNAKPPFPGIAGGREAGAATCVNNKIYFGLGKDDSYFQNDWWEFNPATSAWFRKADFPGSGRNAPFAFTINNMAVAGMGSDGGFANDTWWYNASADNWNYTCGFSGGGRRSVACFGIGTVGYMGTGKASNGAKQDFYRLDADVSVNDIEQQENLISVYPNPVINKIIHLTTQAELDKAIITITDLQGKIIHQEKHQSTNQVIAPSNLDAGIYFISISNVYQVIATKKIIAL